MTETAVKFPNMHEELEFHLSYLSDEAYQHRAWSCGIYDGHHVSFDNIVHFLFDDTNLSRNADGCIGWFICDAEEAAHVRAVTEAIAVMLKTYGPDLTDAQYTEKPEWQHVLATAKAALAVVRANGKHLPASPAE